jgi:hypothetical protein
MSHKLEKKFSYRSPLISFEKTIQHGLGQPKGHSSLDIEGLSARLEKPLPERSMIREDVTLLSQDQ